MKSNDNCFNCKYYEPPKTCNNLVRHRYYGSDLKKIMATALDIPLDETEYQEFLGVHCDDFEQKKPLQKLAERLTNG